MNDQGVFLKESVLDIAQMENLFVTPRMFNFYMSWRSSAEWKNEQTRDQNGLPPICMEQIEAGVKDAETKQMLIFKNGKADYRKMSDIELCT